VKEIIRKGHSLWLCVCVCVCERERERERESERDDLHPRPCLHICLCSFYCTHVKLIFVFNILIVINFHLLWKVKASSLWLFISLATVPSEYVWEGTLGLRSSSGQLSSTSSCHMIKATMVTSNLCGNIAENVTLHKGS
jgi:hypothetical protein